MSTVFEAVTRSRLRAVLAGVALGVVVLGLSIPLTAFALGGSSTPVRLVDADHVGAQAFSNVLFTTPLDVAAGLGDAPVGGTAGGNLEAAHGGARGSGRCSAAVLAAFFEQRENSLRASAWGEALDLDADAVGAHLAILTPAVLLRDTWAVAHTFESGSARPYDAVLRAGTDVLVDLRGVPRVRCADASPLLATRAVDDAEVIGTPWSGFDLADVTAITSGAPVERFVLVDVATGERFERPVGGDGTTDADHVPVPDGDATGTSDDEDALGRPTSTGSSPTVVPSSVVVPDVAGLDRDDALEVLADASLDVEVVERPDVSATTGAGVVLGTEPGAGAELPEGTPVLLVVSSGPVGGGPTSTVLPPPTVTPPTAPPTSRPTTTVAPP
ncbi:MAG: PASTA domain-containing protein, partial [Actinomycetota bacterium]|nr:PASTA domain-containing protein [Actinomycetota bacterium]